jgi:gluconolactonase
MHAKIEGNRQLDMSLKSLFISSISIVAAVSSQELLQQVPSEYSNNPSVVYIANNLAVIPSPFNYTGSIYANPFTTVNVTSDASFESELQEAANASFLAFDPRFFDILGPNPKLDLVFNVSQNTHEGPTYIPTENVLFFTQPGSPNQYYVEFNNTPPTLRNISFSPPINSVVGGAYNPEDKQLYVSAVGGNGTAAGLFKINPATLESKVIVNNYRGLHFTLPDDIILHPFNGLAYFSDAAQPVYPHFFG